MVTLGGRASLRVVSNPPNPWHETAIDWLGAPPRTRLEVYEDVTRSILSRNDSPDVPFTWSVNPYRGCYHGCAYCYARRTHPYLDFGAGTDFERKLVVKPAAAALLRRAFERPSWKGELVFFSGNTDCYQPLEASYGLTRACLQVCLEFRNPVGVVTKGVLVERDLDVLAGLARDARCHVRVSVPFWDAEVARAIEPYVPKPQRRVQAIARLAAAGISVGVNVAPVIPGLNDQDIPAILEAAQAAGARSAAMSLIHLPGEVEPVFVERLRALLPLRAERVLHQIEDCRSGQRHDPRLVRRTTGEGERWRAIEQLFEGAARRLGLESGTSCFEVADTFRRPRSGRQGELFG